MQVLKLWQIIVLNDSSFAYRRFTALYISTHIFSLEDEMDEIVGHTYLFLKEQLEISIMPAPSTILHGTIIGAHQNIIFCRSSFSNFHSFVMSILEKLIELDYVYVLPRKESMSISHLLLL